MKTNEQLKINTMLTRLSILMLAMLFGSLLSAQTIPSGKTFAQLEILNTVDQNTWIPILDGNPKVWKRFHLGTLKNYTSSKVTSIANATALAGITGAFEGDLVLNTARDTLWIRDNGSWLVFKAGSSGSGVTDGSKVDISVSGNTWTINSGVVSWTKLTQAVRDSILVGKKHLELRASKPSPLTTYRTDIVVDTAGVDSMWIWNTSIYRVLQNGGTAAYNGNRTITGPVLTGQNLATSTTEAFLEAVFFPSQVPTSTLTSTYNAVTTASQVLELMSAGSPINVTLNWSSGRQAATQPLASTVVNGTTVTSNPAASASVSGTLAATVVRNTNTTFSNVVTTTDSKTATSNATFTWQAKRYWGSNVGAPNSAQIIAGTNEFATVMSKGAFTITVGGTPSNVFYAYPTSFGTLSSIIISGLESIGAFARTTVSVTNASGYVQNYYLYTSNNQFTSTTISFNLVN